MRKLLILIFLTFIAAKVYSCECAEKPSIKENWDKANQVFTGKIVKVDSLLYDEYGGKLYSFTVRITKSYKGFFHSGKAYRSILYIDTSSCDFIFDVGQEYLIYAKEDSKTLNCSLCSRTNLLNNVSEDEFDALDKLQIEDYKNRNKIRIVKFQNGVEYQIDLVKNSFEESLKRKNLVIYILSGISMLLFLILISVILVKKKRN
ncbi:hypothetical protein [Flavobacterium reichenbachii]|uniref:Tissue inhibitor of metalloproteinase n=1 Tax=Flavobacterium reichenbachii TaxID=362418 RepID=A0A085ZS34_9FLAO|nr:hypothetical protein [Flavobacterium reichenbachii]KFF07248.1 hypothetical protein IW19_17810 [Flavobacterium reichenbachii]OXB13262.1 hypothetical protein B0A68_16000 [Flavobacterium reichenbachii]